CQPDGEAVCLIAPFLRHHQLIRETGGTEQEDKGQNNSARSPMPNGKKPQEQGYEKYEPSPDRNANSAFLHSDKPFRILCNGKWPGKKRAPYGGDPPSGERALGGAEPRFSLSTGDAFSQHADVLGKPAPAAGCQATQRLRSPSCRALPDLD